MLEVLENNPKAFRYIDPTLWNDLDLIKKAITVSEFEEFST